ncbi:MAG TPA: arginyltransferase [Planctomycetota bacterium]|nr:arginyltransferase [Planctomycetota bacterium]
MSEPLNRRADEPTPTVLGPAHPCPYLPARDARFAYAVRMPDGADGFVRLLDAGFRRSGLYVYRTACGACRACRPLRLPVDDFRPNRSQRRALAMNSDLDIRVGRPAFDPERLDLFQRYLAARHDGQMSGDAEEIEAGLYRSPVDTLELTARKDGALKVVGIIDAAPSLLSLVYCAFDPAEKRRSLGAAFVQWTLALASSLGMSHVHLGYWVDGSDTMHYKTRFRPHEVLADDGTWRRVD